MKKALLYVVVPLAILVASLWAVPFILPTSQPRPTMTRAERVEAEQTAVRQAAINRLFGSKPADEPTTTMREELAKGLESDLIKGWAGASDEQILALENEYLAADGRSMQETIDLIREVFDEANLDLTLSDDEIRTSIVNALNHEKDRRGLVGDQPVKRFKTVEAYFSDGNPNPLSHRRGLPNYKRDVSERTKQNGGDNSKDNLGTLCKSCHVKKTRLDNSIRRKRDKEAGIR